MYNNKSFLNFATLSENIKKGKVALKIASPSIIGRKLEVKGELNCKDLIEVEGNVVGNIHSKTITIRESGLVEGDIFSEVVNIKGKFYGNIKSKVVNIAEKANIVGAIEYEILSVEDGAFIDGKFKCTARESESKRVKKTGE
ncbi:polymer-forming cytoskeletal protein [Pseudomonadota bacterium]